jgi:hypothetical protein
VHGDAKQGASFGYTRVRGLNMRLATVSTTTAAPVIVAQRLREGSCGSPRGAKRLVADALKTVTTLRTQAAPEGCALRPVLLRADSAFYGSPSIGAAVRGGAQVSVTVRMTASIKAAIATIADDAWTAIEYTDAIVDEDIGKLISRAEVAEVPFTAFASRRKTEQVPGRLVVRRIPFDLWRFHAFFTASVAEVLDTVAADKTHRGHAIIEQAHADLKNSALAHLPGHFWANSAWLVCTATAFNLTRTAGVLASTFHAKATTGTTIRAQLITVPGRLARSARRLTLHLPTAWPWQKAWEQLADCSEQPAARRLTYPPTARPDRRNSETSRLARPSGTPSPSQHQDHAVNVTTEGPTVDPG